MKKPLFLSCLLVLTLLVHADEGMWIPMLIGKNYDEMVRQGLKLSKDDLYNINHSSMKDAVIQFGGGCTAEIISDNGLVLTNHHCGYDAIANLSTVERNLLDDGFWAHNLQEELPARGVTALFLVRMEDVTNQAITAIGGASGAEYGKKLEAFAKAMEEKESQGGKYVANVKSYFNGNQFLLIIYQRYTDVRLVGNPPRSLGKFGGETDNWMWPRHTCDFSMFRVYADEQNQPRAYNSANVPYRPKKFLPVSVAGEHEGDFAMIFGYPGRTNRYEVSYGVDLSINVTNPAIVACRDLRLNIMHRHMEASKATYLQLTSLYARIANYWKYYIGQTEQLKRLDVVNKKRKSEDAFSAWERENHNDNGLLAQFAQTYADYTPYAKHNVYYTECFRASAVARMAITLNQLYDAYERNGAAKNKAVSKDTTSKYAQMAEAAYRSILKEYDAGTEKDLLAEMTELYYNNVPKDQLPDIYAKVIFKGKKAPDKKAYADYAAYVFSHSFLVDSNKFFAFCKNPSYGKLKGDAGVQYARSYVTNFTQKYQPKVEAFMLKRSDLNRQYLKEIMGQKAGKKLYPDANSTMRITYGKVQSYDPQDGVHYKYYTTLDGLMAKYKPGSEEFDAPKKLVDLYHAGDYGSYADEDGTLHTCFITNNDITGGNSGSPVMNANGELIGAAFDGNWEAMSGDIAFDKKYKRTIVCDIRYILFIVDKVGGADNLIKEMDIRD